MERLTLNLPAVSRVIIFYTRLHIFQFIQNSKHVNEFPQSEKISFRNKVFTLFCMGKPLHFCTKTFNRFSLNLRNLTFVRIESKKKNTLVKFLEYIILTWKYMKFNSLFTSGAKTWTVFSYISTLLGCSFDLGCGIALEQHLHVYSITACS